MGTRNSCRTYTTAEGREEMAVPVDDEKTLATRGYQLYSLKVIGTGSYATVKLGYSQKHDREVAIKVVNRARAPKEFTSKFLPRELTIFPRLCHRNIVHCHEIMEAGPKVYIIMDYAKGGDLLEYVRERQFITEEIACYIFRGILSAIRYLHVLNIAHRDLKCENVLIDYAGTPQLTDFGFAKCLRAPFYLCRTFCGSSAYAPKEILMGVPYNPFKADIWSSGVILYIMTTGTMPYDDDNTKRQLKQMEQGPTFLKTKQPLSEPLKELLAGILHPEESLRYAPSDIYRSSWIQDAMKPQRGSPPHEKAENCCRSQTRMSRKTRKYVPSPIHAEEMPKTDASPLLPPSKLKSDSLNKRR